MQNRNPKSLFGADLNEFSRNANFMTLAKTVDFMYLRSSGSGTGRFRVDKKFIEFAKECRRYGIPVGAYHYAVPSTNLQTADSQCDDFIDVLQKGFGAGDFGDLFPVIDIETPTKKKLPTNVLLDWVDRFRKRFESKTRRKVMLYTGAFFIDLYNNFKHSKKGFILSDMPLWIAMYPSIPGNPPFPKDAGGWTRWRVWQYTEKGTIRGVTPPTDLNWGPDSIDFLTPPRKVKGLKAGVGANKIYVSWTKNTDKDLLGYNLFVNKEYVKTLGKNDTRYTIDINTQTKVKKGSPIQVGIEAFDTDGDFSKRAEIYAGKRDELEENNEEYYIISYPDTWK